MKPPISQRDIIITWHSLATFIHKTLERWGITSPAVEENGYLHTWQVTAHFLGVRDEYIPASWADARYQSDLTLDPVIGSTPEGVALADILLDLIDEDNPGVIRPVLHALVREMVGTTNDGRSIADMLEIPREPIWDPAIQNGWPVYTSMRAAGRPFPGSQDLSWTFDEIVRMGVMYSLNNGRPPEEIYIEMPTANRSEESYPSSY
jgi:endo-cleaving rubber dioxygenase